ncbi:hypothetical protein BGZ80_009326 [Entomortierella chlamydospora]|uniref:Phospholipid-transporting ATPase n=1 Tax=Entomortierella chlamydospora TaxID=101097 RepID=A0A9P6MX12_9FUNG|nr:hypothetical protein BGZ79_009501 [Entomortierella chlamydospora]KAG0016266.1 hypothetical protein BGZ80_009326 [Entomortierella chlamydospora]
MAQPNNGDAPAGESSFPYFSSADSPSTDLAPESPSTSSSPPTLHSRRRRATLQGQQPIIVTTSPTVTSPSTQTNFPFNNSTFNGNALIDKPELTPQYSTALELDSVPDPSRTTPFTSISAQDPSASSPLTEDPNKEQSFRSSPYTESTKQTHPRNWLAALVGKLTGRGRVQVRSNTRVIPICPSRSEPLIQPETGKPFVSNAVTTARYTFWDFLPKQLYAQFSKIANVYFLFVASLQMVPSWSPTGQYTTLVPLLVFLSIAIAHEGYDDYRRHRQDSGENNQKANVFRSYRNATNSLSHQDFPHSSSPYSDSNSAGDGTDISITIPLTPAAYGPSPNLAVFQKIKWKDLSVGDIVRVDQNDWVPADLILLHSAGPEGGCFVETAALDGETNLKQRQSLRVTNDIIRTPEDIASLQGCAHTEHPNQDLYNFEGYMELGNGEDLPRYPLSINQILLRGTILRNTPYIYGLVIFSGEDTKIRQNGSKNVRTKAPSMQRLINRVIVVIFSIVVFLSALSTVLSAVWRGINTRPGHTAWYLGLKFYNDTASVFFGYIVLFNTMIPISLYVTMELVKLVQAYFIHHDVEMYDPISDTPAEARTTVINEELGQVSYLFSDKTGTLTENVMVFRKFCVAGHSFIHDLDPESLKAGKQNQDGGAAEGRNHGADGEIARRSSKYKAKAGKVVRKLRRPSRRGSKSSAGYKSLDGDKEAIPEMETEFASESYSEGVYADKPPYTDNIVPCIPTSQLVPFLRSGAHHAMADRVRFFLLAMALCHDAVPELMDESDPMSFKYQAASPDENALVAGAKELGYVFVDRSRGGIRVRSLPSSTYEQPTEEYYEILNIIEFSSKRKRMSVIYRMPDGRICLFTKGADSIILERVRDPKTGFADFQNLDSPMPFTPTSAQFYDDEDPLASLEYSKSGKSRKYSIERSSSIGAGVGYGSSGAMRKNDPLDSIKEAEANAGSGSSLEDDDFDAYFFGQAPGMSQSEMWEYQHTMDHIQEYATTGLRTLLYGHRFLSEEEYRDWSKQYSDAQSAIDGRQEKLEQVAELLEQNLDMTGATAIEDKLQNGVPETIDKLRRAGIRLWMLTGDKRETAINIGYSCRLIKDYSSTIILDVPTQAQAHRALNKAIKDVNKGKSRHVVVVIDGATLGIVEQSGELMALFVELGIRADSVICCRVSPAQKAVVVKTVRVRVKHVVTLAIGDGANDIAMIQEANVGIGITGKEGLQAARSSDYSIAQFRFLERLLFVHGRWSYVRVSKFVLGTFYKCATFYLTQGLFQIFTGFSGTSLYEQWTLSFYNTLFSSLPVMVVGMFEQDLKASTLLLVPELYTYGQRNSGFSLLTYATWMAAAVYQAFAALMVPLWIAGAIGKFGVEPDDEALFPMGLGVYTSIVLIVTFKIAYLETHNWSIVTHITSIMTIMAWFLYNTVYSFFYPIRTAGYHVRGAFQSLAGHLPFWATVFVAAMIAIIPNIMAKIIKAQMFPTDVDLYQELEKDPEAVQRWKEWEEELGKQGAEAEGVTGSKIQRRLSIAASIVSRQSSRMSSRRSQSGSRQRQRRNDTSESDRSSGIGRRSFDVHMDSFNDGQDQFGGNWVSGDHHRAASSGSQMTREQGRQRPSLSGSRSADMYDSYRNSMLPRSATQLNFPRTGPFATTDPNDVGTGGDLRRAATTGAGVSGV